MANILGHVEKIRNNPYGTAVRSGIISSLTEMDQGLESTGVNYDQLLKNGERVKLELETAAAHVQAGIEKAELAAGRLEDVLNRFPSASLSAIKQRAESIQSAKVDKAAGKGLSTRDFTDAHKRKLAGVNQSANSCVLEELPLMRGMRGYARALKIQNVCQMVLDLETRSMTSGVVVELPEEFLPAVQGQKSTRLLINSDDFTVNGLAILEISGDKVLLLTLANADSLPEVCHFEFRYVCRE